MNERTDPHLRKEIAVESKAMLESRAFLFAVKALRQQWFGELMLCKDPNEKLELIAQLKALEAIPQRLEGFINDEKNAPRK
jgi:hypothetical protein